ncbi:RTA1 like protein-domain-containing protein [Podospora australis]|uniref:RTA1 like protein-domain-containing protein n=1 Tax=Podospora australis TaxID=1536484 RepID=A0AAN6WW68_9PEZI|nr:RTA1 like protein-domain-containing protein [Podospora australis]
MPELLPYRGNYYLWHYIPDLPLSITFSVLFAIATALHTYKMVKTKMWFSSLFVLGGFFEVIGYITRIIARPRTNSLPIYLIQAIFLLLPAVLLAASLYMVYSRIIRALPNSDRFSLISARWTTRVFVIGDFMTLNVQSTGAGMLGKPGTTGIAGNWIVIAGLILQILLFLAFMVVCLVFHLRYRKHGAGTRGETKQVPWEAVLYMLYGTSLLILVRNLFRVVEFVMGQDGYLFRVEWPIFAFDAGLMLLVMIAFYIWYPDCLLPGTQLEGVALEEANGRESRGSGKSGGWLLRR